ncbi:MAG: DUF971 domain-containing protein [Deltaproteobacteria bacterium]
MGLWDHVKPVVTPPSPLSVDTLERSLRIAWDDQRVTETPFRTLRLECPCAGCVEEWSGKRTIDPLTVPEGVRPLKVEPVGNYAISFVWSDGHTTGIYSWSTLRAIGLAKPPSIT